MINLLFDPFLSYGFMRRALIACVLLSISAVPLGGFLLLRRMSLIGDALSHAILPGVAIGYIFFEMSIIAMSIGGFITGLLTLLFSGWIKSITPLQEDASFASFYLGSLSLGIMILSLYGYNDDIIYFLFGSILTIDINNIKYIGIIASFTFLILALFYRAIIIIIFDETFLRTNLNKHFLYLIQTIFLMLVVLNLVAGFQILGTLMSIGMIILPAATARCWTANLAHMLFLAIIINIFSSWLGLLGSFYTALPAGPSIVLCASIIFFTSIILSHKFLKKIN